jgi:hypothetical protein
MMDSMTLGATPGDEKCAQLNVTPNYHEIARTECACYRRQLLRLYKAEHKVDELPEGVKLKIGGNQHDAGDYLEVEVRFDTNLELAIEAAYWFEANIPAHWDAEARAELEELLPDWKAA